MAADWLGRSVRIMLSFSPVSPEKGLAFPAIQTIQERRELGLDLQDKVLPTVFKHMRKPGNLIVLPYFCRAADLGPIWYWLVNQIIVVRRWVCEQMPR
jgi:hypothetical protein